MNRIINRNNTLDQYYTPLELIKQCVLEIKQVCYPSPQYVIDTSCGYNLFVNEMNLPYESYDIDPPKDYFGKITKTNFLKQFFGKIPDNTIIGFNPPFGWRSHLAKQFITKMLLLKPKYIALILLEPCTTNKWHFTNYKTIFEKEIFCHVPCRFFVLEYENNSDRTIKQFKQLLPRKSNRYKIKTKCLKINRKKIILPINCIFVRFTGVNAGLEYYIQYHHHIFYIKFLNFKTKKYKIKCLKQFLHKTNSTTFTKIYYPFENFKAIKQIIFHLHEQAPNVMNLRSLRYNFTTYDVSILIDRFFMSKYFKKLINQE